MPDNFRIHGLPAGRFTHLFALSNDELADLDAKRMLVDAKPGFPCRVSLTDAEIGEQVIALPYYHHDKNSPYR
ncbi:MAG: DUF1203 domain-containing protein, partial [Gammaproteobacteria bacterium]|nr:DUF1203 domain-containing protein [Gammaproteobacteria bacterium]